MTDHRALVERVFEYVDRRRSGDINEVLTPDCQLVAPEAVVHGPAAMFAHWAGYAAAFPESRHIISDMYVAGDTVTVEGTWQGANTGPLATPLGELPATGRPVALSFCTVWQARDGRIASMHMYFDSASMMGQLGLMPQPATA